jgi:hypothetical protein
MAHAYFPFAFSPISTTPEASFVFYIAAAISHKRLGASC